MVVLNNLVYKGKNFSDSLSFRKKERWISQLDLCACSLELIDSIKNINPDQNVKLPSDYAIVSMDIEFDNRCVPARALQEHNIPTVANKAKKAIPLCKVDIKNLKTLLRVMHLYHRHQSTNIFNNIVVLSMTHYTTFPNYQLRKMKEFGTLLLGRLIRVNDEKLIWKAINWKGDIDDTAQAMPSVEDFNNHFENLLNPPDQQLTIDAIFDESPYIPILDDPIQVGEVVRGIKESKADKACRINDISPGVLKILPINSVVCISFILNIVFNLACSIPPYCAHSKLLVIFKKGVRLRCGNYRGISTNDILYRIFDKILYNRLTSWYVVFTQTSRVSKK